LSQEKKILHKLRDLSISLEKMSSMNKKEALDYLFKNHKEFKGAIHYVKNDFIPMLSKKKGRDFVKLGESINKKYELWQR